LDAYHAFHHPNHELCRSHHRRHAGTVEYAGPPAACPEGSILANQLLTWAAAEDRTAENTTVANQLLTSAAEDCTAENTTAANQLLTSAAEDRNAENTMGSGTDPNNSTTVHAPLEVAASVEPVLGSNNDHSVIDEVPFVPLAAADAFIDAESNVVGAVLFTL
jgi:hypothetical protein